MLSLFFQREEYYSEGEAYSQKSDRVHTYAVKDRAQNERGGINMCNVVDQMLETGRSEGIEIGKNEGRIQGSIETYQEMNVGYDNTQFYIEMKYNLSSEKAAEYMKKFWKK